MKFEVKADDLDLLLHELETVRRRAVPFAIRDSLNASAHFAKAEWTKQLHVKLTIRSTWTQRGIRTERATGLDINRMVSAVGSVRGYMSKLEEGGTVSDPMGVPIHTSVASGEGRGARPRTKAVRPSNRLNKIQRYKGSFGSQSQRNMQSVAKAQRGGGRNKVAYMELGAKKGLYKVSGSKRKPRIDLLIDLSRLTTKVKPHPTLQPTIARLAPRLPTIHALAIVRQLRRHGFR